MVILNLPAIHFLPSIDPAVKGQKPFGERENTADTAAVQTETAPINKALVAMLCVFAVCGAASTSITRHFSGLASVRGLDAAVGAVTLSKDAFGMASYGKTYPTINMCGTMCTAAF